MSRILTFAFSVLMVNLLFAVSSHGLTFDCKPSTGSGAIFSAHGGIGLGDDGSFARELNECLQKHRAIDRIEFTSTGGIVQEAFGIASQIAKYGFHTHVPSGSQCISACTLAFLGGLRRTIDPNGSYEVHGFSSNRYNRNYKNSTYSASVQDLYNPKNRSIRSSLMTIHTMMTAIQDPTVQNIMASNLMTFRFLREGDSTRILWSQKPTDASLIRYVNAMNTPEMADLVMTLAEMRSEEITELERSGAELVVQYAKFLLKQGVSLDFLDHMFQPTINTVGKMSPQTLRELSVVTE